MSHTTSHTLHITPRRLRNLAVSLGVMAISIGLLQQVLANTDPSALKPPYHLNLAPLSTSSVILPNPALSGTILISETFDSSYAPTTTLSAVGWHEVTGTLAAHGYTWGRVTTGPHPDSAWVAGTRLNGEPALTPGTDPYTNGMEALLIYGPLDLSQYGSAAVTATYFLDSQPGDYFGAAASTDGSNFTALSVESSQDPSLSVTHTGTFDLHAYARTSAVWIAFYFVSNSDDNVGLGAFVDDTVLRAVPLSKTYLPVISKPAPTPTPTPIPPAAYLYNYTFGSGLNTSNADFLDWGGTYANSCDGSCDPTYGQDLSSSGNPDGAMSLYLNTLNDIAAASPNVMASTNYTYSADLYVVQGKIAARFGLIFGASLSTFGRDGSGNPTFDPNRNFYKFDLQFSDSDSSVVSYYRLQLCQNGFSSCTLLFNKTNVPGGVIGNSGTWNNIKIVRNGSNIRAYVNGTQFLNVSDSTFIGTRKFGVFVQSKDYNNSGNPLKIRFDNVTIQSLP